MIMALKNKLLVVLLLNFIGLSLQQQEAPNFLNFPQGRFLSSFPQSSRNGFFPVQRQQSQQTPAPGSYQQQDTYLDGPTNSPFYSNFQSFGGGSTRSPNLFEISPRPFTVTTSPLQTRGQFSSFGFEANPYKFAPAAQQQQPPRVNPFEDTSGFSEDEYDDRQSYVNPQRSRVRGSALKIVDDSKSKPNNENTPSQALRNLSNKDKLRENLRQRPTTVSTTPEPRKITSTPVSVQATRRTTSTTVRSEKEQKRSRYSPITRSTTSKRPQPNSRPQQQQTEPDIQYNDQTYSFSKNSKVKSPGYDLNVKPLQYQVNISHSESDRNDLSVKSLNGNREYDENSQEEDVEYLEDYEDEDYGVILNEDDRLKKEKATELPKIVTTQSPPTTTSKPEDHTVIIFDNFILPKNNEKTEVPEEPEDEEYDYEYIEEVETTEKPQTTKTPEKIEITTFRDPKRILGEAVVSVVTSKTVVNGTMPREDEQEESEEEEILKTTTEPENYPSTFKPLTKSTTDNYFVIASVQTSRSVSGAHFLPFPHVEQKETKHSRAELSHKKSKEESATTDNPGTTTQIPETENISAEEEDEEYHSNESTTSGVIEEPQTTLPTTIRNSPLPSTESIIDKLDGIQSDLSLGVLSGEFPVLKDASSKKLKTTSTSEAPQEAEISTTVKPLVLIRKFSPKSTTVKPTLTTKAVKTTSTTEEPVTTTQNSTSESNRVDKKITFDAIEKDDLEGLLPPGYKPRNSFKNKKFGTTQQPQIVKDVKEDLSNGKVRNATISRSFKSQPSSQDVKFKSKEKEEAPKKSLNKLFESDAIDISKFLPPDFKEKSNKKVNESIAVIPLDTEDLSKFLPPGYKLSTSSTTSTTEKPKISFVAEDDIGKFLPPGYKPPVEEEKEDKKDDLSSLFSKIKFQETSALLPPGFKSKESEPEKVEKEETTTKSNKLVFPTRPGKKPTRNTTPKSVHGEGPKPPEINIKKGPPTRATTEFTGWPTKPTTPLSIEKILELQKNAERINIADILLTSSTESVTTTSSTTTTTTTTTTTPRPREATICKQDCSLAATIRIIDGVEWSPELLTHHTDEYKKLASELETSLNEVYINSPTLKKWFKGVRIDSFSKGSVLVDYFIELNQLPEEMNTTEIKRIFHEALTPVSMQKPSDAEEGQPQPIIKEAFKLGDFVVDPASTDFIVIQKVATPPPDEDDENALLPQWAIAMITIGVLSLVCVILFGVTVLISRKKAAKKKAPTPLTADMLNELNKNHMGGFENYGADDAYNVEDTWDDRRDAKPKRAQTSSAVPNIYDSWRSQHIQRYQADEFYHYDSHDPYNDYQPKHYPAQQNHPYSSSSTSRFAEANNWNDGWDDPPYNSQQNYNNSRKYYRDYDPHF